jgi:Protein of unknown function (DUF2849)
MQVVTANRLNDGVVVYFDNKGGWSERIDDSLVAADKAEAEQLLTRAMVSVENCIVVEPYLMEVETDADTVKPRQIREEIRAAGPSIRLDLGKQAEKR